MKTQILKTLFTLISLAVCTITNAQGVSWEVMDRLHPIIYPFSIDPNTTNAKYNDVGTHTPLSEDYGYVIIPSSAYKQKEGHDGSLGILVAHHPGDMYSACELRCARCLYDYKKRCRMQPIKSIDRGKVLNFFECKNCQAQIGSFVFNGSPVLDHDNFHGTEILSQETYVVETIWDDYGLLQGLRITNSPELLRSVEEMEKREEYMKQKKQSENNIWYLEPNEDPFR